LLFIWKHRQNRISVEKFFDFACDFVDIDRAAEVEKLANDIITQGVKSKDALHIACAIIGKCDCFLTTDKDILKRYKSEKILVYSPVTFLSAYEVSNA
jgi:predicted nucleic acid-binding protein